MLLVFGRGVIGAGGHYTLTPASAARVRAAVDYTAAHPGVSRIVFAGGWAEAAEGAGQPPAGRREGDLMLVEARAAGLDRRADLRAETRSRSTLENLLHTVEDGLLDVPATGGEAPLRWRSERAARVVARLVFLGAREPSALLRRERRMVASLRRAERLLPRVSTR